MPDSRRVVNGVLLSELDEADQLSPAFEAARETFDDLQISYQSGELSAQEYAEALARAAVIIDGLTWTMGAKSRRWYVKRGALWFPGTPTPLDELVADTNDDSSSQESDDATGAYEGHESDLLGDFLASGQLDAAIDGADATFVEPVDDGKLPERPAAETILPGPETTPGPVDEFAELTGNGTASEPVLHVPLGAEVEVDGVPLPVSWLADEDTTSGDTDGADFSSSVGDALADELDT